MEYPSREMKEFCDNLKTLVEVRAGKLHPDGICECEIDSFIAHYLKDDAQKINLANGLFWTVWVQNTIEKVAHDLYEQFRSIYPFPKLFKHERGNADPFRILIPCHLYPPLPMKLIIEGGSDIWGEVVGWLNSIERKDVVDLAIKAFEEDLKHQQAFFKEIASLWR